MRVVPNLLTASRALAALALVAVDGRPALLWILAWAMASDFLDGFLARRCGWTTPFGAAFDLAADGALFLASFAWVWLHGELSTVWFLLVLAGAIPELAAQAILFFRKTRAVGSPARYWNRVLGGYSYFCVLALVLGVPARLVVPGQVLLELWANSLDLRLALGIHRLSRI